MYMSSEKIGVYIVVEEEVNHAFVDSIFQMSMSGPSVIVRCLLLDCFVALETHIIKDQCMTSVLKHQISLRCVFVARYRVTDYPRHARTDYQSSIHFTRLFECELETAER